MFFGRVTHQQVNSLGRPRARDLALEHDRLDVGKVGDVGKDLRASVPFRGGAELLGALPVQDGLDDVGALRVWFDKSAVHCFYDIRDRR